MEQKYANFFSGFVTGLTQNAYDGYQTVVQTLGFDIDCLQFNVTASSNTTIDILASAFLNKTSSGMGVNATAAGVLELQSPDSSTNTSDHEFTWDGYGSQVFVNKAQWENVTSDGQSSSNASDSGSTTITGSKPFELTLYSKLIDSNSQPGSNDSTSFDTIFLWGSQINFYQDNQYKKRADEVYGVLLSKTSSVDDDKFNNTIALLPQSLASNNVSLVKLNDTCSTSS